MQRLPFLIGSLIPRLVTFALALLLLPGLPLPSTFHFGARQLGQGITKVFIVFAQVPPPITPTRSTTCKSQLPFTSHLQHTLPGKCRSWFLISAERIVTSKPSKKRRGRLFLAMLFHCAKGCHTPRAPGQVFPGLKSRILAFPHRVG